MSQAQLPDLAPDKHSLVWGCDTTPQPSSLQAKAKKLMQKAKKNMRKINFKKGVAQKFREYDQKLEALTNFNVSEAFEKAIQAKDPPNNREGENRKKRRKDVGEPSSRSSRRNKSPTVHAQVDTLVIQPLDQDDEYFDLLLKLDIDQNENHILGPSIVAIVKKLKAIIQKDKLTIIDLVGAGLERVKQQYKNDVELEYHVEQLKAAVLTEAKWNSDEDEVSKNTKPHPSFYNNDFYYLVCLNTEEKYTTSITKNYAARYYKQGIEDMISDRWSKQTHRYIFEALNVRRSNDKEYEFSYADLPRLSLNDVEEMYLLQVQEKLHRLPLEFVKDFNNALLLFIKRVVIQNRVEDIQLGVKSYQQTLNLTKPMMFFKGIDQMIPFTMTTTHKGVVYLNQHNVKSLMRLSEVNKLCDGTLEKICENLIDMVTKNKLGKGNKRLKGREWTDDDVVKSNEMIDKIEKTLKRREQLRRLEEYVGGRPKTVNPYTFNSHDRPEVGTRVFKMKLTELLDDLTKNRSSVTPGQLPSPIHDPDGYKVVSEYMLHGLCGKDAKYAPCTIDGKCSKHFPKSFLAETMIDEDGYPNYL
ncbi:hypothetical protein Tco_0349475 [Tanacetum coccineum]